ncbi:MAG: hypothetical protein NZL90_01230 [Aquificaceae bacterium]|nr:hypothetical protein [Aquificaceae bacterium]MDW8237483.1 hypothetical protein [Aquificaceae bacterium]
MESREVLFYADVFADRYLIHMYTIRFELPDVDYVEFYKDWNFLRVVKDIDRLLKDANNVVVYEVNKRGRRSRNLGLALKSAYERVYEFASMCSIGQITPAIGVGYPPVELIRMVFPAPFELETFPDDLDNYLQNLVRSVKQVPKELLNAEYFIL